MTSFAETDEAGTSDHGNVVAEGRVFGSRDPGSVSVEEPAGVHTVQTTVYRLAGKKAIRCTQRIGKANIFEAAISREVAEGSLIDELLKLLGGRGKPVMAHLLKARKLTLEDVKEAEQELRRFSKKESSK